MYEPNAWLSSRYPICFWSLFLAVESISCKWIGLTAEISPILAPKEKQINSYICLFFQQAYIGQLLYIMPVQVSENKNINKMRFIVPRSPNLGRVLSPCIFWRINKRIYKCGTEFLACTLPRILQIAANGIVSRTALSHRTFCDDGHVHLEHLAIKPLKCD